jgi:hypothetical protein
MNGVWTAVHHNRPAELLAVKVAGEVIRCTAEHCVT